MVRSIITTLKPTPTPKLRVNDLIEASDHPNRSIFALKRGEGLAQFQGYPFIMESCYHITSEEYERRRNLEWPTAIASTTWKQKMAAAGPAAGEKDADDEVVTNKTSSDQPELQSANLLGNESPPDAVREDDVSETTELPSLPTIEAPPLDAGNGGTPLALPDEPVKQVDDIIWDGDRPIPANPSQPTPTTDRAADVDPQALKDLLKALDEFNL